MCIRDSARRKLWAEVQAHGGYRFGSDAATDAGWAETAAGQLVITWLHVEKTFPGCWPGSTVEGEDRERRVAQAGRTAGFQRGRHPDHGVVAGSYLKTSLPWCALSDTQSDVGFDLPRSPLRTISSQCASVLPGAQSQQLVRSRGDGPRAGPSSTGPTLGGVGAGCRQQGIAGSIEGAQDAAANDAWVVQV